MKYCIRPSPWPQDQKQYTRLSVSYPSFAWLLSPDVTTTSTPAPACLVNGILSAALSGLHLTHNVTIHLIGHELFCNRPTNMAVHDSHETHSERHSQASCNAIILTKGSACCSIDILPCQKRPSLTAHLYGLVCSRSAFMNRSG